MGLIKSAGKLIGKAKASYDKYQKEAPKRRKEKLSRLRSRAADLKEEAKVTKLERSIHKMERRHEPDFLGGAMGGGYDPFGYQPQRKKTKRL